jgi:hypothetical protein
MSDYSNTHWMKDEPENFHCKPDSEFNLGPQKYIPEIWRIEKDLVYKLIPALEAGLENTQSVLVEHDAALGRTTAKNKMWAEILEREIRGMEDCIKQLKLLNISHTTHYP